MGLFSFVGKLLGLGGSGPQKIELSKVSASAGLPIIYGTRRVEPITVFKVVSRNNMPVTNAAAYDAIAERVSGHDKDKYQKSNDWLHRVDVWGQGKITGIKLLWIDGDSYLSPRFNGRPYFRGLSKFGNEDQCAAAELVAGHADWESTHEGNGVAYTWSRFYNSGKEPQFEGEPRLEAEVEGLKCFDPRPDTPETKQDFHNPDKWIFTDNRALIVLNYLMANFGFAAPEEDLDLESFKKAADACDELMEIPLPAKNETNNVHRNVWNSRIGEYIDVDIGHFYPQYRPNQPRDTGEQPKYAAGAVLDPKEGVVKNVKQLLEGMGWALPWSNGRHKLIVEGEVDDAVMHFDADSIIGGWTVERGMRSDRLNRVTIEFPNANKDYQDDTVSWPPIGKEIHLAYKAEDQGQDLHTNKSVETITDFYRAQAYAEYLVRKSRVNPRIKGLKLAPKAMLLEPGDVISIYYEDKGFGREITAGGTELAGTLFIVERVDVSAFLDVTVDLIKYDPTVYGAPALEQEPIPGSPYNPDWWRQPPAVESLALTQVDEANADGTVVRGIEATWTLPEGINGIASVNVEWKKASEAEYSERMTLAAGSERAKIMGVLNDAISYDVRVSYKTQRGQQSASAELPITMTVVQSVLDLLAEGQLDFADYWNFGPTDKGWTVNGATVDVDSNTLNIHTTSTEAELVSPDGLRIDGSKWDKVIVRLKRLEAGDGAVWEHAYLYYNTTTRGGFDTRFREFSNARYVTGKYVTFVFDMSELSSGSLNDNEKDDWVTNTITRLRFDPTITSGDHLAVDWIGVGRAAPAIASTHAANLVSDLGFKKFEAVDTDADSNFTAKKLDAMNLKVGDDISAGIEVMAEGARRGRLKLEFLNASDAVVAVMHSPWSLFVGEYEQVTKENISIPVGTYRIRAWLERENAVLGAVGARYYTLNAGHTSIRYAPVRDDVQEGATRTVAKGQYDVSEPYEAGDIVSHNGSSYVYINSVSAAGHDPLDTNYWTVLASAGSEWHTGEGAPLDSLGEIGDYYLNKISNDVYKRGLTSWGAPVGNLAGDDGDKWFSGSGAPAVNVGTEGDHYIDKSNGDIYEKISDIWSQDGNLTGPAGQAAQWHTGTSIPSSTLGVQGDFHLNPTTGEVHRKISASQWVSDGNLKGADGDKWYSGYGSPSNATGKEGDNFLSVNTNTIYTKYASGWQTNFALTDNLGDLASLDKVNENDIWDGAVTDIGETSGSSNTVTLNSGTQTKTIATLYVSGNPNGVKIFAKANLRNADGNTTTLSMQVRNPYGSVGEIITPVSPNTRVYPINTRVSGFSGTQRFELSIRWYGATQKIAFSGVRLEAEGAKK